MNDVMEPKLRPVGDPVGARRGNDELYLRGDWHQRGWASVFKVFKMLGSLPVRIF